MASHSVTSTSRSEDSDAWEDDLLIKEYEKVTKQVNETIKQRLKKNPGGIAVKKFVPKNNKEASSENDESDNPSKSWQRGQYCRAVYSEDSVEYEAQIISIHGSSCLVKYIGYENEEEQELSKLLPSKGKIARKLQQKAAHEQMAAAAAELKKDEDQFVPPSPKKQPKTLPVIPPPPSHFPEIPSQEDEALASMLMSWYMSGYHTGYYQALRHIQSNFNN